MTPNTMTPPGLSQSPTRSGRPATAPMSRWKAAGIHLLISAGIAGSLVALMLAVWYPWPLFELAGGSGLTIILVGVDMVLGPLITLVIFRAGKKGLKFDLAVIAALQLSALAYGVHAVYAVRPAYEVFTLDRFDLVAAVDLDPADLAKATREEFRSSPATGPRYVAAVMPDEPAERQKILESGIAGKDLQLFPQHYVPFEQQAKNALRKARSLSVLAKRDPNTVQDFLASSGRTEASVKFLPLRARSGDGAVLLDAESGMPLRILRIDPW